MKIVVHSSNELLSRQAAKETIDAMLTRPGSLLCAASGDSPAGLYRQMIELIQKENLDASSWNFIGLDEWSHMNENDEGSCRYWLDRQLFNPLGIQKKAIYFFNGRSDDRASECHRAEIFIKEKGGIDVAILGLGLNGHIGMNEPGTAENSRSHVAKLDTLTKQTAQKYFPQVQELDEGLTLGLATLMESRRIQLIVSGKHKASIVKKIVEEEISTALPGSLLRRHPSCTLHLDQEAASLLQLTWND
jgi:glucosamine-6-phosphate isomerase